MGEYGKVKKGRGVVFAQRTDDPSAQLRASRGLGLGVGNEKEDKEATEEKESEWMATLLWGTKLVNIPLVHPRRQREMAEGLVEEIGLGLGRGVGEDEDDGEGEEPQIISRVSVACITDVPTPGAANICMEIQKESISRKSQKDKKKTEQKIYSTKVSVANSMQWLTTKYENIFPWFSERAEEAEVPASHRYLASFSGKALSQEREHTPKYPEEPIVLITAFVVGILLFLKGSRRS